MLRSLIVCCALLAPASGFAPSRGLTAGARAPRCRRAVAVSMSESPDGPGLLTGLQKQLALKSQFTKGDSMTAGGFGTSGEAPIQIRGFSLGNAFIGGGALITITSFAEYFGSSSDIGLSGLGFVCGPRVRVAASRRGRRS